MRVVQAKEADAKVRTRIAPKTLKTFKAIHLTWFERQVLNLGFCLPSNILLQQKIKELLFLSLFW